MKKKMHECIFGIFQCSGTNEKKKIGVKPFLGYCPIYIVKKKKLYCKIMQCIITERWLAWEEGVL